MTMQQAECNFSFDVNYRSFKTEAVGWIWVSWETIFFHSFRSVSSLIHICFQQNVLVGEVSVKS
jgi:hypothetical protein